MSSLFPVRLQQTVQTPEQKFQHILSKQSQQAGIISLQYTEFQGETYENPWVWRPRSAKPTFLSVWREKPIWS